MRLSVIFTLCALTVSSARTPAQVMGSLLPPDALQGLSNTGAKSLADYEGRCLLIEFFAYW